LAETFRGAAINVARKFAQRALRSRTGAPVAGEGGRGRRDDEGGGGAEGV